MTLHQFFHDDAGAVTVDWTVMTAAIVGLGIASYSVIAPGIADLSGDTDRQMRDQVIRTAFFQPSSIGAMDFTGGDAGDWVGGQVMSLIESLGEMLVLGPGETASLSLEVPEGAQTATVSFDLIGGDSLDNEVATITTNGRTVTLARGHHDGTMIFTTPDQEGVQVQTEVLSQGSNIGGSGPARWRDSVTRVTITVDDPGTTLDLGMTSAANQPVEDEFFGIDNVDITAE